MWLEFYGEKVKIVGLAFKQQADQGHALQSGFLSHLFEQGGFDETQANHPDGTLSKEDLLSLDAINHAEWNLGHLVETPHDLDRTHLDNVFHIDDHRNHKIIEYSRDDVHTEQKGASSDANLATAGGYLKKAIQDPDAHKDNERKKNKRNEYQLQMFINEHEKIARALAELEQKIEDQEQKIAKHNEHIQDIDNINSILEAGDINDRSKDGQKRRQQIEVVLQKQGLSLDDFRKQDGTIDQEALKARMDADRVDQVAEREAAQQQLNEYRQEYTQLAEKHNISEKAYEQILNTSDNESAILKEREGLSKRSIEQELTIELSAQDEHLKSSQIDDAMETQFQTFSQDTAWNLEEFSIDGSQKNLIRGDFSRASNPEIESEMTREQTQTFSSTQQSLGAEVIEMQTAGMRPI